MLELDIEAGIREAIIKGLTPQQPSARLSPADYEHIVEELRTREDDSRNPDWEATVAVYCRPVQRRRVPRAWWGWIPKLCAKIRR